MPAYTPARPAPSYRARCGGRRSPRHGRRAGLRRWRANSAGQAALHLAKFATRGHTARPGRVAGRQHVRHLITQLKATPSIGVRRLRTRVADGHGQARLAALTLEDVRTGQREQVSTAAVFVMIGAEPRAQWRRNLVKLNDRGFVLTGRDVPPGAWPLPRPAPAVQDEPARRSRRWPPRSGNLRAASRAGQSDRLQPGPPGAQAIRVCHK